MHETQQKLLEQFIRFERLTHRYQRHNPRGQGPRRGPMHNPHRGQGRVLSILKLQPEISQKELGYLLDMSKQALAEILGKLERADFITRTQSEKDRRAYIITLTEKGRNALKKETEEAEADEKATSLTQVFDCLSEEEQQNLSNYLSRIIAHMEENFSDHETDELADLYRMRFFADHGFDEFDDPRGPGRRGGYGRSEGPRGYGRGGEGRGFGRGRGRGSGPHDQFEDFDDDPFNGSGDPELRRWRGRRRDGGFSFESRRGHR